MKGIQADGEIRVLLDESSVPNPHLVKFEITNLGPQDLSPGAFAGGHLRFLTSPRRNLLLHLDDPTTTYAAMLQASIDTTLGFSEDDEAFEIVVEPCQLKVGEVETFTALIANRPEFRCESRLTSFSAEMLSGDKPDDFEITVDMPFPFGLRIPLTYRRKRH